MSEDMEEEAGETTLYYDAEEGTLRDEDGDEVTFDMGTESSIDASEAQEEGEEEEGSRTPQPAASASAEQRATQTITSTSPTAGDSAAAARRPGRLRRLSSATQSRVSSPLSFCTVGLIGRSSLRYSNPATDPTTAQPGWYPGHVPA